MSDEPLTPSDIRNLSIVVDVCQKLGGLTKAVSNLEEATKSNIEKIDRLTQSVSAIPNLENSRLAEAVDTLRATTTFHADRIDRLTQWVSSVSNLERDVAQNKTDLNKVGKRLEIDLNEVGKRLEREINELKAKDIGELTSIGHLEVKSKEYGEKLEQIGKDMHAAKTLIAFTVLIAGLLGFAIHELIPFLLLPKPHS